MNLSSLSNEALIRSLKSLVGDERGVIVAVLRHLSEFDSRRIAEDTGFPSLFDYCVRELRYAQGEAFRRIRAARAAKRFEILYEAIEDGSLTLTTVAMLEPHLTWGNYRKLIRAAKGTSTREVEALVSSLNPVAAAPVERIRILTVAAPPAPAATADDLFPWAESAPAPAAESAPAPAAESAPAPAAESAPAPAATAPGVHTDDDPMARVSGGAGSAPPSTATVRRVLFSFTSDEALLRDFERVKQLSRHKWPAGTQEEVFAGAIRMLLDKIDPDRRRRRRERARRLAAGARSRHVSSAVKDEVWVRDEGRCVYRSADGRLCGARDGLEFDHARPWALGGTGEADNVRLLCRAHNAFEARRVFGGARVDAAVARRRASPAAANPAAATPAAANPAAATPAGPAAPVKNS